MQNISSDTIEASPIYIQKTISKQKLNTGLSKYWELVFIALIYIFRYSIFGPVNFPNQSGFEEDQIAVGAFHALQTGAFPLEFRFTIILGWLGFYFAGVSLEALRFPFLICGGLVVLITLRTLQMVQVPQALRICLAVLMIFDPWLCIANSNADEIFSALIIVVVILLALTSLQNNPQKHLHVSLIALILGACCGILSYEYASFKSYAFLAVVGLFFLTSINSKIQRLVHLFCFLVPLILISWPFIMDIINSGWRSAFFDGPARHSSQGYSLELLRTRASNVWPYFASLFGHSDGKFIFFGPDSDTIISKPLGISFLLAICYGLIKPRSRLAFLCSLHVCLCVFIAAFAAGNVWIARLSACIPLLYFLLGLLLTDLTIFLKKLLKLSALNKMAQMTTKVLVYLSASAGVVLFIFILSWDLKRVQSFYLDHQVQAHYSAGGFAAANFMSKLAVTQDLIYLIALDNSLPCSVNTDLYWLLRAGNRSIHCIKIEEIPTISSNELSCVVIGSSDRQVTPDEESAFTSALLKIWPDINISSAYNAVGRKVALGACAP